MDTKKLYEILQECTVQLRKGPAVEEKRGGLIVSIYAMPHVNEAEAGLQLVDMHFIVIGVDKAKAERCRSELIDILNTWPDPAELAGGPSYIAVGGTIGDQGAAFQLFALGKVLLLWHVITPESLGVTGERAEEMAGNGFIMCTGYRREAVPA